jgi:hypothetical protein
MSGFRVFDHRKIYPSTELVKNNLCTIRYTKLRVYQVQVVWIEADYCFSLTAQDDKMLEVIQ